MTTQYAGLDLWVEEIEITTDDDVRDASSITVSAIGLADRSRYLKNRGFYSTPAFGGTYTNAGTYRVTGQIIFTNTDGIAVTYATAHRYARTANLLAAYYDPAEYTSGVSLPVFAGHYFQIVDSQPTIVFEFDIPSNCVLKGFSMRIKPANTHVAIPVNKPKFDTYLVDTVAGTTTVLVDGSANDPTVVLADYNAIHTLTVNLTIEHVFDASRHRVFMVFFGEGGAGYQANLEAYLPTVEYTRLQIGEEFGELLP